MASAGQAVKRHCSECLGIEKGHSAFDCKGESCPLFVCSPFRGKLLPIGQRPGRVVEAVKDGRKAVVEGYREIVFDEAAEIVQLADLAKQYPKRQPSGSLCSAMCRECMGVRVIPGMEEEQKGGGERVDCHKDSCALHPWQPYQKGGRQRSTRKVTPEQAAKASERGRQLAAQSSHRRESVVIPAPEPVRTASATGAQVPLAL